METDLTPVHGSVVEAHGLTAVFCGRCKRWVDVDDGDDALPALMDHVGRAHRGNA